MKSIMTPRPDKFRDHLIEQTLDIVAKASLENILKAKVPKWDLHSNTILEIKVPKWSLGGVAILGSPNKLSVKICLVQRIF